MRRQLLRAIAPALALPAGLGFVSACTDGPTTPVAVGTVVVTPSTQTLASGASLVLSATTFDAQGRVLEGRSVTWSSANVNIAEVSAAGVVTAGQNRTADPAPVVITAASEGQTGTATLTVTPVTVARVVVSPDSLTLLPGESAALAAVLQDGSGAALVGRSVTWSSTDTTVLTVSPAGLVLSRMYVGPAERTARVVVAADAARDTVVVRVPPLPVARLEISRDSATLLVTDTLAVTVRLFSSSNQELSGRSTTLTSTDGAVAAPASGARVVGTGRGTARVIATSATISDTLTVHVVTWQSVAAGGDHTCALTTASDLYCWGWNADGQLGIGTQSDALRPVHVSGARKFDAVAAGTYHSCALAVDGAAVCWGRNSYGQIGDGSATARSVPTPVSGALSLKNVSAGETHSCGISTQDEPFCWGNNSDGELGDGSQVTSAVPVRVAIAGTVRALEARNQHSCALTAGGTAMCWGLNSWASLGLGFDFHGFQKNPTNVGTSTIFSTLMPRGHWHSCALTAAGVAECWGLNARGQIGNPSVATQTPTAVPVVGGHIFKQLAGGGGHIVQGVGHTCGVRADGALLCWGDNTFGQGGAGFESNGSPIVVVTPEPMTSVATGAGHTCALSTSGQLYCFGRNSRGSLGTGSTTSSAVPTRVRLAW